MKKNNNVRASIFLAVVVLLVMLFISFFYGKILLKPNDYIFSSSGDGMKNYYTYAYYIDNNKSLTNFEGLNYPYGENFLYTDCHPLIAYTIKSLSVYFPLISNYKIGVINFLMIISFFIEAIFIYLILKNLKVNLLLASLSSVAIVILSPQVFRLGGHYALSYGFFMPILLYFLLKYEITNKRKYIAFIFINNLTWFFIHSYLGLISIGFLFLYLLLIIINDIKKNAIKIYKYLLLFGVIFLPTIIFYIFVKSIDLHPGRTTNPYGFFEYYADFDTVLLPNHKPLKAFFDLFLPQFTQTWEGWNYIGVISISSIFIYFLMVIKEKKQRISITSNYFNNTFLIISLLSSIGLLLFSTGFPFRFGLESFLDYLPILKQFRAIGRFSWPFFFLINISSIYFINNILTKNIYNKKYLKIFVIVTIPIIIGIEGVAYHKEMSDIITKNTNIFDKRQLNSKEIETINNIDITKYQAIIPLPFYYIGSENFGKYGTDKIYKLSMLYSYHFKLPIFASYLTRTSIQESKNIMQLLSDSYYKKQVINDISSRKSFLVIYTKENLTENEQILLDKCNLVYSNEKYLFYEIGFNDIFKNTAANEIKKFKSIESNLFEKNGFLVSDSLEYFFYNDFENYKCEITHTGKGALKVSKNEQSLISEIKANNLIVGKKYIASFWFYNKGQDRLNNSDLIQENVIDNKVVSSKSVKPMASEIISGDWSLIKIDFKVNDEREKILFYIKGNDINNTFLYIDDAFVYEENSLNYKVLKLQQHKIISLFKNNNIISLSPL